MHPDVIWHSPSTDEDGSMPLGNGEVGVNVWTEHGRDLCAYVARTDAWDEDGRLCKIGRLRLHLPEGSFAAEAPFEQRLDLATATVRIRTAELEITVWVDVHHPALRVAVSGRSAFAANASIELWRRERTISGMDEMFGWLRQEPPFETVAEHPDVELDAPGAALAWCHHNRRSCWTKNLETQFLGDYARAHPEQDPLLHRTFGGLLTGDATWTRSGPLTLVGHGQTRYELTFSSACERVATAADLLPILLRQHAALPAASLAQAAHDAWWNSFWQRSWIRISGDTAAEVVSLAYTLQRYLFACAGRGRFPIKFNGSLFTVRALSDGKMLGDVRAQSEDYGPDWRRWGGCYWFQNTRLAYWPMVMAGDADLATPLFAMYRDCLPLARARTQLHHGVSGVTMPETTTFWGTWGNVDYGYPEDRARCLAGDPRCFDHYPLNGPQDRHGLSGYLRRYFSGTIELIALGLDLHAHTHDRAFVRDQVLPLAREYLTFFRAYFRHHGPDGKLLFWPSQSLETWQDATDPLPEIAGLRWVLERLLILPDASVSEVTDWRLWLSELPAIPTSLEGQRRLLPARVYDELHNCENPELYAVFPYRLYGVGKPDLPIALETWKLRLHRQLEQSWINGGWFQDPVQAALLGLASDAKRLVTHNATSKDARSRFPAFFGPNFDWMPDQDHGGVLMLAVQRMVLQAEPDHAELLPAWPAGWSVDFRLHAPGQRVVEGVFRDGAWQHLDITKPDGWRVTKHEPQVASAPSR